MAQQLEDSFDFSRRRKTYDFSQFADGKVWGFTRGEDFQTLGITFVSHARVWAKEHDMHVSSKVIPATTDTLESVVLRFAPIPPDEGDLP